MKKILLCYSLLLLVFQGYALPLKLQISDNDNALMGAHVYLNSIIQTVTDRNGEAVITNIAFGDTISVTCLGYHPFHKVVSQEVLSGDGLLKVNMSQLYYNISEVVVTPYGDMDILKQKLRPKLRLSTNINKRPIYGTQTINILDSGRCFTVKYSGSVTGKSSRFVPVIKDFSVEFESAINQDSEDHYLSMAEKYQSPVERNIRIKLGNSVVHADRLLLFNSAVKVFYRGEDNGYSLFYFDLPRGVQIRGRDNPDSYISGMAYINASNGILERIDVNYISFVSSLNNYTDTYYFTLVANNKVWIKEIISLVHILDEQLNVIEAINSRIVVDNFKLSPNGNKNL